MLYRRVRLVAIWRRSTLTARDDPDRGHAAAAIMARLLGTQFRTRYLQRATATSA
jgi:hypothetical protein